MENVHILHTDIPFQSGSVGTHPSAIKPCLAFFSAAILVRTLMKNRFLISARLLSQLDEVVQTLGRYNPCTVPPWFSQATAHSPPPSIPVSALSTKATSHWQASKLHLRDFILHSSTWVESSDCQSQVAHAYWHDWYFKPAPACLLPFSHAVITGVR